MTEQPRTDERSQLITFVASLKGNKAAQGLIPSIRVLTRGIFVELALPKVGQSVKAGEEFGEVESVKAVSPMYSPVSGEIVEVHDEVVDRLESLGTDPYDGGWLIKVKMSDPTELDTLLNFNDYQKSIAQ